MKTSWVVGIIIVIAVVLGGWYWYGAEQRGTYDTPDAMTGEEERMTGPVLKTGTSTTLGTYLTAANGMTLYKYTNDTPGVSNCSGACAVNWPPYTVSAGEPLTLDAVIAGTLSTITRADGTLQVAYNGTALYFWKDDVKVGDTTGQNVGGVWFVVTP